MEVESGRRACKCPGSRCVRCVSRVRGHLYSFSLFLFWGWEGTERGGRPTKQRRSNLGSHSAGRHAAQCPRRGSVITLATAAEDMVDRTAQHCCSPLRAVYAMNTASERMQRIQFPSVGRTAWPQVATRLLMRAYVREQQLHSIHQAEVPACSMCAALH